VEDDRDGPGPDDGDLTTFWKLHAHSRTVISWLKRFSHGWTQMNADENNGLIGVYRR